PKKIWGEIFATRKSIFQNETLNLPPVSKRTQKNFSQSPPPPETIALYLGPGLFQSFAYMNLQSKPVHPHPLDTNL
ncbi:hypothetical protein, partial [Varibaculum cambriense]|uniref:hypothetical protein n=1 Tax=Varibaculum cambriense TaxID=184870 RepID=UPI0028891A88